MADETKRRKPQATKTNPAPRWWCAHGYLFGCAVDRRVLIVFNDGGWYVRSVGVVEHDMANDAMVYRCDEHVSGPHRKPEVAMRSAQRWLDR